MQAIVTRYAGPTNYRSTRVIAKAEAGRLVVDWDGELDVEENHVRAAELLIAKLGWDWARILGSGSIDTADAYVHVLAAK